MNIRSLAVVISGVLVLSACKKSSSASVVTESEKQGVFKKNTDAVPEKHAQLVVTSRIDMGVFEGEELVKSSMMSLTNAGNDTLYLLSAQPECDCTTVEIIDSVVPPKANGRLKVTLDLTTYPSDTIYKDIDIISNSYGNRVQRFMVYGIRK